MQEDDIKEIKKSISDIEKLIAVGFSRIGLSLEGAPVNGLFTESKDIKEICKKMELDLLELVGNIEELNKFKDSTLKEISEIKESLKGNITLSGIHKFLIQLPAIISALGIIVGVLIYIFNIN